MKRRELLTGFLGGLALLGSGKAVVGRTIEREKTWWEEEVALFDQHYKAQEYPLEGLHDEQINRKWFENMGFTGLCYIYTEGREVLERPVACCRLNDREAEFSTFYRSPGEMHVRRIVWECGIPRIILLREEADKSAGHGPLYTVHSGQKITLTLRTTYEVCNYAVSHDCNGLHRVEIE